MIDTRCPGWLAAASVADLAALINAVRETDEGFESPRIAVVADPVGLTIKREWSPRMTSRSCQMRESIRLQGFEDAVYDALAMGDAVPMTRLARRMHWYGSSARLRHVLDGMIAMAMVERVEIRVAAGVARPRPVVADRLAGRVERSA